MQITEEDFKKYLSIVKGLEHRSVNTYANRFKIIVRWLKSNNVEPSKRTISNFLYMKREIDKLSPAGVNTYIQTLQHIQGCYKYYDFDCNFADDLKCLPKTQPDIVPLSVEEVEKLLSVRLTYANRNGVDNSGLDFKYLSLTAFFLYTGCRFGEATSLKIRNLDIDNGRATLLHTKNKTNRYIFFREPVQNLLRKLVEGRGSDELVFTNSKGNNFYYGDFNENLKRRAKKAGITKDIHAHILRHTYATLLFNETHDITMLAKILGHKDIKTTADTYVHLDTEEIQRTASKHPLLARYISPSEVLENVGNAFKKLKINEDDRFEYDLKYNSTEFNLTIKVKNL